MGVMAPPGARDTTYWEETAHQQVVLSGTVRAKLEKLLRGRRDDDDFGLTSPVLLRRVHC
jgi:hypothetical protein